MLCQVSVLWGRRSEGLEIGWENKMESKSMTFFLPGDI